MLGRRLSHIASSFKSCVPLLRTAPARFYAQPFRGRCAAFTASHGNDLGGGGNSEGNRVVAEAVLEKIEPLSPTVRLLTLRLQQPEAALFTFLPGMWVDFYIPAIDHVGGYTIISLPEELPLLNLAVKITSHPPAAWIGKAATPGDKVTVRAGGNFHLGDVIQTQAGSGVNLESQQQPMSLDVNHLMLVAGGIGLTPLYAMVRHWEHAHRQRSKGESAEGSIVVPRNLTLLYSCRNLDEMVFLEELQKIRASVSPSGNMRLHLHITGQACGQVSDTDVVHGRIALEHLVDALDGVISSRDESVTDDSLDARLKNRQGVLCCICGPQAMTDGTAFLLKALGLHQRQVRFEKWW